MAVYQESQVRMSGTDWTRRLLVLGLRALLIAGCAATLLLSQEALAETQQTGTPFSSPSTSTTQAGQATKITPEQEAALVEVRKILREASEVVQGVKVKNPESKEGKFLQNNKNVVLRDIVSAQARSVDIEGARETAKANQWERSLPTAIALAKAGQPHAGLKELASLELDTATRLVFVKAFVRADDRQAASDLAESPGPLLWQAPAIAYLASLQARQGDLGSRETFHRALQVAQAFDKLDRRGAFHPNIGKYKALVHIARYQAEAGDATGSLQTFLKARETALATPDPRDRINALLNIAGVQAWSGDQAGSERTFAEAIQVAQGFPSKQQEIELGEMVRKQLAVGNRAAAMETVRLIMQMPSGPSLREQALGLMRQASWHVIFGDHEAARGAIQAVWPNLKAIADAQATTESERNYIYWDLTRLAAKAGDLGILNDALSRIKNDQGKVGIMHDVVIILNQTSPTGEVSKTIHQLADDASKVTGVFSSPSDPMLKFVAVMQAAAGDLKSATRTANRIEDVKHGMRERAYMEMAEVLINKADWKLAQQVVAGIKQHWSATFETYRKLARAQAKAGDGKNAADRTRQQEIPLARGCALLGVAEGLMDFASIEPLLPTVHP